MSSTPAKIMKDRGASNRKGSSRVSRFAARLMHASVEGSAFLWTTDGMRAFMLLHSLAVMWALGPRRTVGIGLQCGLACSAARFAVVLYGSRGKDAESLESIWDFVPSGDLGESGAWTVLTELAKTISGGGDAHEELRDLETLPLPDLLVRLLFLYRDLQEHPVSDKLEKADIIGEVSSSQVETLCQYLYYADQAYDCGTEDNLKSLLEEEGYELNFAKLSSTWAEHRPAYFVATHPKKKEVLMTIRGTAQVEDVVTDLTALPVELEASGELVHGGMQKSATWLFQRSVTMCQAMADSGYRITIVGHSLGAGAAAILAILYKQAGIRQVHCYAFATPNCVDLPLAERCAEEDLITSVVFRDDIVARFSPQALADLLQQLKDFDLDQALEQAEGHDDKLVNFAAFVGSALAGNASTAATSSSPKEAIQRSLSQPSSPSSDMDKQSNAQQAHNGKEPADSEKEVELKHKEPQERGSASASASTSQEGSVTEHEASCYRAHIPGRVIYIYRKGDSIGAQEEYELALVKTTCSALRQIRLSNQVVKDHVIDSYFKGLGRENPSRMRERQKQEAEKKESKEESTGNEEGEKKEQRRRKGADLRDKESKDEGRSWMAKLGLVG